MTARSPQEIADQVRRDLYARDRAAQMLAIEIMRISPGAATLTMTVRDDMLNGHDICHGGLITTLADTCFAYACNSYDELTVASGFSVDLMAPGRLGDVLTADGVEVAKGGRTGLYDVTVSNQRGERIAVFRGRSYTVRGKPAIREGARARHDGHSMKAAPFRAASSRAGRDPIEHASRDEIVSLQLARLRATLGHAYAEVAHYRAAFDAAGVHPDDLKQLSDLSRFPFTTKQDLRANYPFGLFAVPREQVVRVHASSGTTGKPTVVGYTQRDIDTWADLVARSIHAAGGRRGDMIHVAYGYGLFTGGLGAHYGAERLGCTVIPMSGGQTEKQVQLLVDFRPDIIMVTPSYMQVIVEEFERQGIDPAASSMRIGIFGAEPWTEAMRADIERRAGLDAVDIYGLSEVMGPGVASECIESKDGPVIWEDHFYPEIVDPETGEVLPDGVEGELVFTSLTKEALPIVRYRTRDLTRLLPPTSRAFRRMGKIVGRSDDMLIIRGVNVFPTQLEEIVLQHAQLSGQYQIVVTRDGPLDEVELLCEFQPHIAHADTNANDVSDWLQRRIKTLVGISTRVSVLPSNSIERTLTGKARRVVDKRGP